jgi:hypothetical protein
MGLLKELKISRRFAMRGMLGGIGVAVWLPVLDAMCNNNGTAFAAGDVLPTSFGIWFWGNGIHKDVWTPTGGGAAWELPENLQDFADVKQAMTLLTGLDMLDAQFKGHGWGVVYVLAGGDGNICTQTAQLANLGTHEFETSRSTQYLPTIDQTIADAIHTNEPFKSFETGMLPFEGDVAMGTPGSNLAHRGPNDVLPPRRDPKVAFDDLFSALPMPPAGNGGGGGASTGAPSDISAKLRKSALDAVLEDLNRLKPTLGAVDNARIDSHIEGVRELERKIEQMSGVDFGGTAGTTGGAGSTSSTCKVPDQPPATLADMTAKSQAMNRLIVAGLACNLTRVFTHMWSGPRSDSAYPTLSLGAHHAYTHSRDGEEPRKIERYIMSQYADLAKGMQATRIGDRTLLDQTLIYGISELPEPKNHIMKDYHVVLMGHAGGKLPGNRYVTLTGRKVTELGLTMQQLMGMDVSTWGTWDRTSRTIPEIL